MLSLCGIFHAESVLLFDLDGLFLAQDTVCGIISIFLCFSLAQRDGKPVSSGQKSVSFLNNNISPKVSSSMNGMFQILKVSPEKILIASIILHVIATSVLFKGILKETIQEIQKVLQHFVL